MSSPSPRATLILAALFPLAVLSVLFGGSPATAADDLSVSEASQQLKQLRVKGRAPLTGYERDQFGTPWKDVDGNGCDTRNDILRRDLSKIVDEEGSTCVVKTGVLNPEPYTARNVAYTRGKSTLDIDHVVALGNAWVSGAWKWSSAKRLRIANDPLNLLAVDYSANRQKGDADAATWLPPNKPYRCQYVARQVAVKHEYGLTTTKPEKTAMRKVLNGCAGGKKSLGNSEDVPQDEASQPGQVLTEPVPGFYKTCDEARLANAAPIVKTVDADAYAMNSHLDGDKDGVACDG